MKHKNLIAIITMIFVIGSFTSCKKYDDGGLISKADKRLTEGTWELKTYLRNGNDETSKLLISNYTEEFKEDGSYIRTYVDKDGDNFSENGTWVFDDDKMQINLTGVSSIELTDETSTVSTSDYNITKLKKDELWYYYENGGDTHEFRLVLK